MDRITKKKDNESKNDPPKEKDDKSNTHEKSEKGETSDASPSEEQSGTKPADVAEKSSEKDDTSDASPDEKQSGTKSASTDKGSENASVNESEPQGTSETNSKNSQEVEETESKSGAEGIENSEANGEEEDSQFNGTPQEDKTFTFDEMVNIAGYGRFQRTLTFLAGLGWLADAFEIRVMGMIVNVIACDWTVYKWASAILQSIVFIGMIFGAPVFGIIADKFGRRKSLAISLLCLFIFGASSALSHGIVTLLVLRCITGFVFGGATQGFTLCAEYYPVKGRGTTLFYLRYYWSLGTLLLILMTWLIIDVIYLSWHWLILAAATPSLIVFFSMNWFPESARWYLVSGYYEKAVDQLDQLLATNGCTELHARQLKRIPDEEKEVQGNLLDLLRSPFTKTTLLLWYISFAVSFHYFGLNLIAPYVIMRGDIMGLLIFTLVVRFAERRTVLGVSCMINAFGSLLLLAAAQSRIPTQVVLFFLRANCTGILQLVMIIITESFPTTLRATGVGSGEAFMRLGGAVVPFVTQILIIQDPIAAVCIMGAVMLGAAASGAYLPRDTKGMALKELTEHQRQADQQKREEDKETV